jgi:heptosyltransferase-1
MKILLIKMSSMGDIFHTFPAITDLKQAYPDALIDWVVEEGFAEIAAWHPAIHRVIPIGLRRWLKARDKPSWNEFNYWRQSLRSETYDLVIDAQGLFKSALIARCAQAKRIEGYSKRSAREPLAALLYHRRHLVGKERHAVERTRQLFSQILGYSLTPRLNFGINQNFSHITKNPRKLVFVIGTTWVTKLWASSHWQTLAQKASAEGYSLEIIWGSESERIMADEIIAACPQATRPQQRLSITTIAEMLVEAACVVGLDTGFSHLAGALETPTIALYGATSPAKVGLIGPHTVNLQLDPPLDCMPCHKRQCKWLPENSTEIPTCMTSIQVEQVWHQLQSKLNV